MKPGKGEESGPESGREQVGQKEETPAQIREAENKGYGSAQAVNEAVGEQERETVAQDQGAGPGRPGLEARMSREVGHALGPAEPEKKLVSGHAPREGGPDHGPEVEHSQGRSGSAKKYRRLSFHKSAQRNGRWAVLGNGVHIHAPFLPRDPGMSVTAP